MLIGPNGEQLGVMSSRDANNRAKEFELDLLCVAPNATPPVCKILNYGKYKFEQQKKAKESKKKQHIVELKEIQLTPQIGQHDIETKRNHAVKFLQEGNKVKVALRFRGRQMSHIEVGQEVLDKFVASLDEYAIVEKPSILDGKILTTVLASKVKK